MFVMCICESGVSIHPPVLFCFVNENCAVVDGNKFPVPNFWVGVSYAQESTDT